MNTRHNKTYVHVVILDLMPKAPLKFEAYASDDVIGSIIYDRRKLFLIYIEIMFFIYWSPHYTAWQIFLI